MDLVTAWLDVGVLDVEKSLEEDIHDAVGVVGGELNKGLAVYNSSSFSPRSLLSAAVEISGIFIFDWLNKPDID